MTIIFQKSVPSVPIPPIMEFFEIPARRQTSAGEIRGMNSAEVDN